MGIVGRDSKSDLKMPEVPEGKIIITTDSTSHRRVLLGAANVRNTSVRIHYGLSYTMTRREGQSDSNLCRRKRKMHI